jgi:hypothetical protein
MTIRLIYEDGTSSSTDDVLASRGDMRSYATKTFLAKRIGPRLVRIEADVVQVVAAELTDDGDIVLPEEVGPEDDLRADYVWSERTTSGPPVVVSVTGDATKREATSLKEPSSANDLFANDEMRPLGTNKNGDRRLLGTNKNGDRSYSLTDEEERHGYTSMVLLANHVEVVYNNIVSNLRIAKDERLLNVGRAVRKSSSGEEQVMAICLSSDRKTRYYIPEIDVVAAPVRKTLNQGLYEQVSFTNLDDGTGEAVDVDGSDKKKSTESVPDKIGLTMI